APATTGRVAGDARAAMQARAGFKPGGQLVRPARQGKARAGADPVATHVDSATGVHGRVVAQGGFVGGEDRASFQGHAASVPGDVVRDHQATGGWRVVRAQVHPADIDVGRCVQATLDVDSATTGSPGLHAINGRVVRNEHVIIADAQAGAFAHVDAAALGRLVAGDDSTQRSTLDGHDGASGDGDTATKKG